MTKILVAALILSIMVTLLLLFAPPCEARSLEIQTRGLETPQLQSMVDECNKRAENGTIGTDLIMVCSVAYDELVHKRYGSYDEYTERK